MEEEKKKRKNKKKKHKQTKGIENNAVGAEELASSYQNHPAEIHGSEAHTDGTSGIDNNPNRHDTDGAKVSSLAENDKHRRMDTKATFEEKIKQLQKDKVAHMQKEAIFEEKLKQLSREKDASLLKEASFEEKIMQSQREISSLRRQEANQEEKMRQLHMEKDAYLQKEVSLERKVKEMEKDTENRVQKEVGLEERISFLVGEVENLSSMRVSLERKVKEMEKERDNWVQKEKSFREIISSLSGDNALLEAQVKEFEELRTNIVQENQLLKENVQALQTQVNNLEKGAGPPCSPKTNTPGDGDLNSEVAATQALVDKLIGENAELVEKVKNLCVELERRGSPGAVSSFLGSDIIATSSEAAHMANKSALGSHMMPGAVHEREIDHATEPKSEPSEAVLLSREKLQSLKDTIEKAASDHEHVSNIDSRNDVKSSEIESDEIVQIPLDENEVQSADLEAADVDQDEEEVPLTNAPLIGAPFRLISFVARYVSGADLVNKNSATSNR